MILKNKVLVVIAALLMACGTSKKTTKIETLPSWVTSKPIIEGYYVGLGSAQKTMNLSTYQNNAKNNALADMASEISVTISTQSVLYKFENTLGFKEDFSTSSKMLAQESLEGYEKVNSYESETHYYLLYKLSKATYKQIKEEKKNAAVSKATDFLLKAQSNVKNNEINKAIFNYAHGLQAVKPYFADDISYTVGGKTGDLSNDLFSGLMATFNDIIVEPKVQQIDATKGKSISPDQLAFHVKTLEGNPIQGLPVIFSLGSKPLRNSKVKTDAYGKVNYDLVNTANRMGSANFIARLDASTIASQSTNDPLLRRMIRKMDMPEGDILIKVENPTFFVESKELNLGNEMNPKILKRKMEQVLTNNDFPVVYQKHKAHYSIQLSTDTYKDKKEGRMHNALLKGEIKVFNSSEQLILSRQIKEVRGVQLSYTNAGLDAYNNLGEDIQRVFIPRLKEALK